MPHEVMAEKVPGNDKYFRLESCARLPNQMKMHFETYRSVLKRVTKPFIEPQVCEHDILQEPGQ